MKNRFKHKLAWWLRKWANKLEPQVCAPPTLTAPHYIYGGKVYELSTFRMMAAGYRFWSEGRRAFEVNRAKHEMSEGVIKLIESKELESFDEEANVMLQLLILTPKDRIYETTEN